MHLLAILLSAFYLLFSGPAPRVQHFYVSTNGNNANAGTKKTPFASVAAAQKAVRDFKKKNPGVAVTVMIEPGTYYVESALQLTAEDGGTANAPVTYKAAKKEVPVFTGGKQITQWSIVTDEQVLSRLSPETRGKVYEADLSKMGIIDFGDPTEPGKRPELFCNNQLQTLARWPNSGFTRAGKAKGATALPPTYIKVNGTVEGVFEYTSDRESKWTTEQDVRIGGYFYWDWAEGFQKVVRMDTHSKTMVLNSPHHSYGYADGFRYFGLNILSELDTAGEWYLDRDRRMIYWYPPQQINPNKADVVMSVFSEAFMVTLTECAYLSIEGLAFRETRGSVLGITGGNNNEIKDCRFERMGKDGIHISGGKAHTLTGNYLSGMGYGGIKIKAGDRKTLTHSEHIVENNIVEYFSRFKRTYEPAVHFAGCGITIRHNRFRYSSSSAMRLDGNDMLVEYNEVSFVVNESDDQGAVDMFYNPAYRGNVFRYNYWSDVSGGTKHGAAGIRLDDMISGTLIYGNVFEKCGVLDFGAVQIHGGKENIIDNNVFYNCHAAVSFSPWSDDRWLKELESDRMKKMLYEDVDINSPVYVSRYPELKKIREGLFENTVSNNLIVDCKKDYRKLDKRQTLINNHVISSGGKNLRQLCEAKLLSQYNIKPIPLAEIGLRNNRWVHLSK